MTTSKRLAQVAKTTLVLPFLLTALLGLGLHASAASHTTFNASHSSHAVADVDPFPPSH